MNTQGKQYIDDINKRFKVFLEYVRNDKELRENILLRDNIRSLDNNGVLYERLMRLGVESRVFKLSDDDEHRLVALASLKEDILNRYEYEKI